MLSEKERSAIQAAMNTDFFNYVFPEDSIFSLPPIECMSEEKREEWIQSIRDVLKNPNGKWCVAELTPREPQEKK